MDSEVGPVTAAAANEDSQDESFVCAECGATFGRQYNLQAHASIHQPNRERVKCRYCEVSFYRKGDLVRHEKVHKQGRLFPCMTCGKGFSRQDHLTRHAARCPGTVQRRAAAGVSVSSETPRAKSRSPTSTPPPPAGNASPAARLASYPGNYPDSYSGQLGVPNFSQDLVRQSWPATPFFESSAQEPSSNLLFGRETAPYSNQTIGNFQSRAETAYSLPSRPAAASPIPFLPDLLPQNPNALSYAYPIPPNPSIAAADQRVFGTDPNAPYLSYLRQQLMQQAQTGQQHTFDDLGSNIGAHLSSLGSLYAGPMSGHGEGSALSQGPGGGMTGAGSSFGTRATLDVETIRVRAPATSAAGTFPGWSTPVPTVPKTGFGMRAGLGHSDLTVIGSFGVRPPPAPYRGLEWPATSTGRGGTLDQPRPAVAPSRPTLVPPATRPAYSTFSFDEGLLPTSDLQPNILGVSRPPTSRQPPRY